MACSLTIMATMSAVLSEPPNTAPEDWPEGTLAQPPSGLAAPAKAAVAQRAAPLPASPARHANAQQVLQEVFGYPAFRGAQRDIVEHVVAGGDALVLMPTGGGKSLCYQVPAIVRHRAGAGRGSRSKSTHRADARPGRCAA